MSNFSLTSEQQLIVHSSVGVLLVQAFAGTGKTSTLVAFAKANPGLRILYLAFNKPIQMEAARKFPSNVKCQTTHGLADRRFGAAFKDAGKLGSLSARGLMKLFDLEAAESKVVLSTLECFTQSAAETIADEHVSQDVVNKTHRARGVQLAQKAWGVMQDKLDPSLRMTHDVYLKLFQLSEPDLSLKPSLRRVPFRGQGTARIARQAVPGGGAICGDEQHRAEGGARSALQGLARRDCLSAVSEVNVASFAARPRPEQRSAVPKGPPRLASPPGIACRAAPMGRTQ